MNMKLAKERQNLVLNNQELVHFIVRKWGIMPISSEYDDIVSVGTIGLIKAAITFKPSKQISFEAYASRCINDEINIHYYEANRYADEVSINELIRNDKKGKKLTVGNTIKYSSSNFVERIETREAFIQVVNIILNYLRGKARLAILYKMGDTSREDIAERLNVSKRYVSGLLTKAINDIRRVINYQIHYKNVFSMDIIEDEYRISFSSKDISNFSKIFANLLRTVTSTGRVPDFRVVCNREQIMVQIPAYPDSFYFIAKIIQEIDNFSMTFISDKRALCTANTVKENELRVKVQNLNSTSDIIDETNVATAGRGINIKRVRDYMLSMSHFTINDLRHHFPNIDKSTIYNAVSSGKRKGLITAIGRGQYLVITVKN